LGHHSQDRIQKIAERTACIRLQGASRERHPSGKETMLDGGESSWMLNIPSKV
jgi:hypothetical protein